MATTETVHEEREETQLERNRRLDLEREALRPSPANDSLRNRLLAMLAGNQYAKLNETFGVSYERALFKYAAATTKAVAMALKGHEYVCSNEPYESAFTDDDAAIVLCGLSAILEEGPELIDDINNATVRAPEVRQ